MQKEKWQAQDSEAAPGKVGIVILMDCIVLRRVP